MEEEGGAIVWKAGRVKKTLPGERFVAYPNDDAEFTEEYGLGGRKRVAARVSDAKARRAVLCVIWTHGAKEQAFSAGRGAIGDAPVSRGAPALGLVLLRVGARARGSRCCCARASRTARWFSVSGASTQRASAISPITPRARGLRCEPARAHVFSHASAASSRAAPRSCVRRRHRLARRGAACSALHRCRGFDADFERVVAALLFDHAVTILSRERRHLPSVEGRSCYHSNHCCPSAY